MGGYIAGKSLDFAKNYKTNTYSSYTNANNKKTITYPTAGTNTMTLSGGLNINVTSGAYVCYKVELTNMFTVSDLNYNGINNETPTEASLFSFDSDAYVVWGWKWYNDVTGNNNWGKYEFIERLYSGNFNISFSVDETYLYIKLSIKDITKLTNYSKAITDKQYGNLNKTNIILWYIYGALKYNGKYVLLKDDEVTFSLEGQSTELLQYYNSGSTYKNNANDSFVVYENTGNNTPEILTSSYVTASGSSITYAAPTNTTLGHFIWCLHIPRFDSDMWEATGSNSFFGYSPHTTISSTTRRELVNA